MGGVYLPVNIHLDRGIDRNYSQAADHLGVVADLLGPQHQLVAEALHPGKVLFLPLFGEGDRGPRGGGDLALLHQLEYVVLKHFGIDLHRPEIGQPLQHGVADGAHPSLHRQQALRQPAGAHLPLEKIAQAGGDTQRYLVGQFDGVRVVRNVAADNGRDLVPRHLDIRGADAFHHPGQGDGAALRRLQRDIDVMQPLQLHRLGQVDLDDYALRLLGEGGRVAHRGSGDDLPFLCHRQGFDYRHVHPAQVAVAHLFSGMAQVLVNKAYPPGVNRSADRLDRLVGQALVDHPQSAELSVQLLSHRGSGPDVKCKLLPGPPPLGQGRRQRFGIAGPGHAAGGQDGPVLNPGGRLPWFHDALPQPRGAHPLPYPFM